MFGVDSSELIIVAVLALLFIGPKELPSAMRTVGRWVGKVRAISRHFTSGLEAMIREAELEEMEKKWREENDRIMREHPQLPNYEAGEEPAPSPPPVASLDEPRLPLGESGLPPEKRELP